MPETIAWTRTPVTLTTRNELEVVETYGFVGSQGITVLEGQLLKPEHRPSDTVFLFMHPTSTLHLLPMPTALADRGLHVLCCGSRYAKNDSALIMEKVALDLGAYMAHARTALGYEKVVLVGWSGGGSLSLFYQAQAESPTITHTPAGDPVNLVAATLVPADGVVFIAAHLSRAETLTEWLDPSILDEVNPDRRDREFDIYSQHCPNQPPYSADFVAAFRKRQRERNARITDMCQDLLERFRREAGFERERGFVVHRTMCDVRWLDPLIDPNDRKPNWTYIGHPAIANAAPAGLARYSSLRSWLSQWSFRLSNAKGPANAARIHRAPVLQIENTADDAVPATHNPAIHAALQVQDKEYVRLQKATHYYLGQPDLLGQCIDTILDWCGRHGFLAEQEVVRRMELDN